MNLNLITDESIYVETNKNGDMYIEEFTPHSFEKGQIYETKNKHIKKFIVNGLGKIFDAPGFGNEEYAKKMEGKKLQRIYIEKI